MENFDDNIENEYRKRFTDFEEMPDDLLWKNIQAQIRPERKRPLVIWWNSLPSPMGVAASLLIGLAVGAYFLIRTNVGTTVSNLSTNHEDIGIHSEGKKTGEEINQVEKQNDLTLKKEQLLRPETKQNEKLKEEKVLRPHLVKPVVNAAEESEKLAILSEKKHDEQLVEKLENKERLAVSITPVEPKTEQPVVIAEEKQDEAVTMAKSEEIKLDINRPSVPTEENKPAATEVTEQLAPAVVLLKDEVEEILKDTLFRDVRTLSGKGTNDLVVIPKQVQLPELPEPELPVIVAVAEKNRLVFIPPTEIFANVNSSLNYYMFSPNKGDQILVNNFSSGSQRLGFAAQLGFVYPITKKMDLRTGFSYFTRKARINYGVLDDSRKSITVLDDNSIQINPGALVKNEDRHWQYFELQSDVLYEVKPMQAVSLGMKFGVQTSALNSPLVQARIGYRISKAVADHWALWLEPAISVSLSSHQSIENLFMYRTTGFGLNMGVSLLR